MCTIIMEFGSEIGEGGLFSTKTTINHLHISHGDAPCTRP